MHFVLFCHSLVSDWNHGNAHFLRGVVAELQARGHRVTVYEPHDSWSRRNLLEYYGDYSGDPEAPLRWFRASFPTLESRIYDPCSLDLDDALGDAGVAIVHEWNDPAWVGRIGAWRAEHPAGPLLLFHDTHHRAVTEPRSMAAYDLRGYDGVLAFGRVLRDLYLQRCWARRAWIWHEAADTRVFYPRDPAWTYDEAIGAYALSPIDDLVFVGNWGDDERKAELFEFLVQPCAGLSLRAHVYGVRYSDQALGWLVNAGINYEGWLPNHKAPDIFAQHRLTIHVPRRPYARALPGIPTIRVFEALACGIPLICAPWQDSEGLFTPGEDYLVARDGAEMTSHIRAILAEPFLAASLRDHGLATIRARHTCAHRVDELLAIVGDLCQSTA